MNKKKDNSPFSVNNQEDLDKIIHEFLCVKTDFEYIKLLDKYLYSKEERTDDWKIHDRGKVNFGLKCAFVPIKESLVRGFVISLRNLVVEVDWSSIQNKIKLLKKEDFTKNLLSMRHLYSHFCAELGDENLEYRSWETINDKSFDEFFSIEATEKFLDQLSSILKEVSKKESFKKEKTDFFLEYFEEFLKNNTKFS